MNKRYFLFLILIILLALALRFYKLAEIPAGLHYDAASQAYNAFSLLQSGKDHYGEPFPILFRANGSYQPPLYTYLSTLPVLILGNTILAAHFISALAGTLLVLISFFFLNVLTDLKKKPILSLIAAFIVAISPWAVLFSRIVIEANLSVLIFAGGVTLLITSLKKIRVFPLACLILGLSTHTYYTEQITVMLFLPLFLLYFRRYFRQHKTLLIIGLFVFLLIQLPHIVTIQSGAFTRRFSQVSYVSNQSAASNLFIINILDGIIRFLNQYFSYFMPNHLFFDYNPSLGRTIPGLGVFYSWLIVPFLWGIRYLIKYQHLLFSKVILLLVLITPIPAGLTGDQFYPLRTLTFLWIVSIIIALGIYSLSIVFKNKILKLSLLSFFFLYSIFSLYISYFVIYKYENPQASSYNYPYVKLMDYLPAYRNQHIFIDSTRDIGIGLRIAYLTSYSPEKMQAQLRPQLKSSYYNNTVNIDEIYSIENIEIKPFKWQDTCKENALVIGDLLTVSDPQISDYQLKKEFEVNDITGKVALIGYSTHPKTKCQKQSF